MYEEWFTDRRRVLRELQTNLERIRGGFGENLALIGLRRLGKTQTLLRFKRNNPGDFIGYLDIEGLAASPEVFALRYVGIILGELARCRELEVKVRYDPIHLMDVASQFAPAVRETARTLAQELDRARPSAHNLVSLAFGFPEVIAEAEKINPLICLDEFQELLALRTYRDIRNILGIFRAVVQQQKRTRYLLSGSAVRLMETILKDPSLPLFAQFKIIRLEPFSRHDTYELAEKIWQTERRAYSHDVLPTLYILSYGHPFYITTICLAASALARRFGREIEREIVQAAFLHEVLGEDGRINLLCDYIYNTSLSRVQGGNTLRTVMQILAGQEGLTLTEIGRQMHRPAGQVGGYVKSLLDSDLLIEQGKRYFFRDPVLRFWLAKTGLGLPVDYSLEWDKIKRLGKEFEERFMKARQDVGAYFEGYVRDICRSFRGQQIKACYFGQQGMIRLPAVKQVTRLKARDEAGVVHGFPSQVEADVYLTGEECWLGEVKHKGSLVEVEDLALLERKADLFRDNLKARIDRLWFISALGFKENAVEYAQKNGILVSTRSDLKALAQQLM